MHPPFIHFLKYSFVFLSLHVSFNVTSCPLMWHGGSLNKASQLSIPSLQFALKSIENVKIHKKVNYLLSVRPSVKTSHSRKSSELLVLQMRNFRPWKLPLCEILERESWRALIWHWFVINRCFISNSQENTLTTVVHSHRTMWHFWVQTKCDTHQWQFKLKLICNLQLFLRSVRDREDPE